jgi:hypothetical protein
MSFAAMASWQAWLVVAAAIAVAVAIFLMKLRPPQIIVPSMTLWRRVLDESRERSLWERIRKAVSLAIVVLITLAIAMAILRPQGSVRNAQSRRPELQFGQTDSAGTKVPAYVGSRLSIVLDSSWSMLAETSSGRTRWDRAVSRARALAASAGGEEVVLSTTADGVIEGPTPDVALIEAALDRISPSGGDDSAWPRVEGARATHFLTDGAVARVLDPSVIVESVFEAAPNVAITAFDVRPGVTLESAGQAFLEVANYATTPQKVRLSLSRGNASVLDVTVDMAAGAAVQRIVPLDRGGDARLRARITAKENALVVDDDAVAWIADARPIAVTVVSDQPAAFGVVLSKDPSIAATYISSRSYAPATDRADVVIFDRVIPEAVPTVPALFVAPSGQAPEASWLRRSGNVEDKPEWPGGSAHAILAGVDTQTMTLTRAQPYDGAGLAVVSASATGTPLVYVRDEADQRFVVFTFSVTDAKLMFAPGFPVLLANAIDWLAHPGQGNSSGTRRPGQATFDGAVASLTGPNGKEVPVARIGAVSVATLGRPGFYEAKSAGATSVIAVNAGDPEISNLQRTRLIAPTNADASTAPSRGRPWWLIAAALALLLLAAEWVTWQRRITV